MNSKTITANETDIQAAFKLYENIVKPNELGLSPEVYEIFTQVIEPNMKVAGSDDPKYITRKEILMEYFKKYHRAPLRQTARESVNSRVD